VLSPLVSWQRNGKLCGGFLCVLGPGKELVFKMITESWPLAVDRWSRAGCRLERIRIPSLTAMVLAAAFTIGAVWRWFAIVLVWRAAFWPP